MYIYSVKNTEGYDYTNWLRGVLWTPGDIRQKHMNGSADSNQNTRFYEAKSTGEEFGTKHEQSASQQEQKSVVVFVITDYFPS